MRQPRESSFHWLNATQFFGSLNDNLFKWFLIFFLINRQGPEAERMILATVGAVFVVPFLLFSDAGGTLADRYSKGRLILGTKVAELTVMVLGLLGFLVNSPALLYATLFLMAAQSSIFGPSKFGIIPELVPEDRLSRANGQLLALTFLAIILGTGLSAGLAKVVGSIPPLAPLCLLVAGIGLLCSQRIGATAPVRSSRRINPLFMVEIARTVRDIAKDRPLLSAVVGQWWFWMMGAFLQMTLLPYGREVLGVSKETSGLLFLFVSFGIAIGTAVAGRISGRLIEFGLVPVGALGMAGGLAALCLGPNVPGAAGILLVLGVASGVLNLPLTAFVQWRVPERIRGRVLATVNVLNFTAILAASGLMGLCGVFNVSATGAIAGAAVTMVALTVYALVVVPDFLVRFLLMLLIRTRYRIVVRNAHRLPLHGRFVLVANSLGFPEWLSVLAVQQRRTAFVVDHRPTDPRSRRLLGPLGGTVAHLGDGESAAHNLRASLDRDMGAAVFDSPLFEHVRSNGPQVLRARLGDIDQTGPVIPLAVTRRKAQLRRSLLPRRPLICITVHPPLGEED